LSPSLLEIQCIIFIKWSFIFCLSSIYVICLSMYDWTITHYIFNLYSLNNRKKCKIAISCFLKLFKTYISFCIHWIYRFNTSTKTFLSYYYTQASWVLQLICKRPCKQAGVHISLVTCLPMFQSIFPSGCTIGSN